MFDALEGAVNSRSASRFTGAFLRLQCLFPRAILTPVAFQLPASRRGAGDSNIL
jgi:hypothetical protein